MDTFLMNNRPMGPKDWGFDVAVTAAAFLFGCVQLMLAASSIVIPDLALRQYLGMVNVVPNVQVFVALAVTTLPLVVRRRFPWPVFLFCLVSFLGLQNAFNGFSLTIVGPVVALYTIASERGRAETVAAVLLAVAGLLFADAHAATANMVLFTRFQNIVLAVAAGLAGYAYRTHRAYVKATEDRAAEAERTPRGRGGSACGGGARAHRARSPRHHGAFAVGGQHSGGGCRAHDRSRSRRGEGGYLRRAHHCERRAR